MRYRLVIFDWDGTLMDSAARIVACMQAASQDAGWGHLEAAAVRDIIGLGLPEAIDRLCPGIDAERFELLRNRYAYHFVEGNAERRLAVATGKSRRGLDRVFHDNAWGAWFHASRTADETRSKPHPQMLQELLIELDVPVEEAVMVGDSEYDLEMARALGMDRVAVTWGVHAPERLAASRPSYTATAVTELFEWLN